MCLLGCVVYCPLIQFVRISSSQVRPNFYVRFRLTRQCLWVAFARRWTDLLAYSVKAPSSQALLIRLLQDNFCCCLSVFLFSLCDFVYLEAA